jgi:hypothetical protein
LPAFAFIIPHLYTHNQGYYLRQRITTANLESNELVFWLNWRYGQDPTPLIRDFSIRCCISTIKRAIRQQHHSFADIEILPDQLDHPTNPTNSTNPTNPTNSTTRPTRPTRPPD